MRWPQNFGASGEAKRGSRPMTIHHPNLAMSRRSALAGLGAGGLGLVLAKRGAFARSTTPTAVQIEQGVVYGEVDSTQIMVDVVRPADRPEPLPAVVLIHGGAMMFGGRVDLLDTAEALAGAGYAAFTIDYRL